MRLSWPHGCRVRVLDEVQRGPPKPRAAVTLRCAQKRRQATSVKGVIRPTGDSLRL